VVEYALEFVAPTDAVTKIAFKVADFGNATVSRDFSEDGFAHTRELETLVHVALSATDNRVEGLFREVNCELNVSFGNCARATAYGDYCCDTKGVLANTLAEVFVCSSARFAFIHSCA